ncbi:type III restriction endonuclease subunit M [Candidatus Cloacimonadaceae bacterium]
MEQQVVSKHRVAKYGEVLTGKREVNAMLDLVKQETERIDSRFLEPACGTGNFLAEILERKLAVVEKRYKQSQFDYERFAVLAVSSIYGIDIQEDNVLHCRQRLFGIFELNYLRLFKDHTKDNCRESVRYILECNIVHGDALTLMTQDNTPKPIVFSEWSLISNAMLKRRDFSFSELLEHESYKELPLWSDMGEEVFIPTPVKDYPPVNFLKLNAEAKEVEASSSSLAKDQPQDDVDPIDVESKEKHC